MIRQEQLQNSIIQTKQLLRDLSFQHYSNYELFSRTWWVAVALLIIPLIIWWIIVDKKRLLEICAFGLLVNIAASLLDVLGSDYVLWEYPVHVLPQVSLLVPVDYVIVPVAGMIMYQKTSKWKTFLIASIVLGAFMSFVGEPLAVLLNLYKLFSWRYIYSYPIYVIIYIVARFVTQAFRRKRAAASGG